MEMTTRSELRPSEGGPTRRLGLYQLLDPAVAADPYPLYHRLRDDDPVLWDPFLHAWVVTRYNDVMTVLHRYSADRTPTPEQLEALGLETLAPVARVHGAPNALPGPAGTRACASPRGEGLHPSTSGAAAGAHCKHHRALARPGTVPAGDRCHRRPGSSPAGDRFVRAAGPTKRRLAAADQLDPIIRRTAWQPPAQSGARPSTSAERSPK